MGLQIELYMKLTIKLTHSHMHTNTHTLQTHFKKEYENRTTTEQTISYIQAVVHNALPWMFCCNIIH